MREYNTPKIVLIPQSVLGPRRAWAIISILRVKVGLEGAFDVCFVVYDITLKSLALYLT
jgi:hypothetical protein